jgi:hypothetical protein
MLFQALADLVVLVHFGFIVFVVQDDFSGPLHEGKEDREESPSARSRPWRTAFAARAERLATRVASSSTTCFP